MNRKVLVFDLWGDYAHFKKPYTTTSPLTYSIPSRTALTGILGAILGIDKNKNNTMFNYSHANIALQVINPLKKTTMNQNLINTKVADSLFRMKKGKSPRTQIKIEYLKNVRYRLYIELLDKKLYDKLKYNLENHISYYTCSLGLSENIANFKYVAEYEYLKKDGNASIGSIVNLAGISSENIVIDLDKEYFTDRFPLEMQEDREVTKYGDILYERNGKSIEIRNTNFIEVETGVQILWY